MKTRATKIFLFALALCMLLMLEACENRENSGNAASPQAEATSSSESNREEITNVIARELFEKAADEIITLASENPADLIKMVLRDDVQVTYNEKNINGVAYYETTASFEELQDYYSQLFSGDALSWVLSTKFADVDGTLYCSSVGGASGWSIADIEIELIGQNNGTYAYEAVFNRVDRAGAHEVITSRFSAEKTEYGYRISSIDNVPDLLEK